jgi:acetyl esterase/lipase
VGGISAGGGLAAVVSHLARDEKLSPPLTGVHLIMPIVASTKNLDPAHAAAIKSYDELSDAPVLPAKVIETFESNYAPDPASHLWNLFAPPVQFDNLPPTFLQIGGMDPLRDEGLLYEKLLRENHGVKTKLEVYPGLPHAFYSYFPDMEVSSKCLEDLVDGMRWLLSNDKQD